MIFRKQSRRRGFTLVEMLSALALSALLISALLKLQQNAGLAHVAAEERAAATQKLIVLRRELAAAVGGMIPACAKAKKRFTLINDYQKKFWLRPFQSTVRVYAASASPAGVKKTGKRPGERRANSDVLVTRGAVLPAVTVTSHTATGAFHVSDTSGFKLGDAVLLCDEEASVLFQITDIDKGLGLLRYSGGGATPGNCANAFHDDGCARGYHFSGGAVAARYAASVFYVGVGKSGDGYSLYRRRLPGVDSDAKQRLTLLRSEEIVTGIRRMTARVVVRDGDRFRHANSDAAGAPFAIDIEAVIAARSGLAAAERHAFTLAL